MQNDILKEFMVRNTYIYPPEPSMRIVADIIEYTASEMPKFNSISISGYHMQEAGATLAQELAYTLADGMEYVRAAQAKGLSVDAFAGRLSFFFCIGMNVFMEAAKLRAARAMWSKIMTDFGARSERSKMLRTHCQTSGVSLTEQDPYNNIVRTAFEAMAAVLGGTQSLHTNSFDEAIALPTEFFRPHRPQHPADPRPRDRHHQRGRPARRLLLCRETHRRPDGQGLGADRRGGIIGRHDQGGGNRTAEDAHRGGRRPPPGPHRPRRGRHRRRQPLPARTDEPQVDILNIDTDKVRAGQVARLNRMRETRDSKAYLATIATLEQVAASGQGNLLAAAVDAARARASLGEISDAMERGFGGRHHAVTKVIGGVYADVYQDDPEYQAIRARISDYSADKGHAPYVLGRQDGPGRPRPRR